jgi:hypothetical protein
MKKGEKALKYADLLWGGEKVRRITLEDFCRGWALNRLRKEEEVSFGMRVHSYRERFKLSLTKKATLFYAYNVFHDWAKTHQPHLNTKTLHKLLLYLTAYTLVPKIYFCTCKEVFSFFKYDLPKLRDRDRKKPRPLELYQRQSDPQALAAIHQTLSSLQNPKNIPKLGKLFGIPLHQTNP